MDDLENLRTIAEISIALTGFTGIVAAFGKRKKGRWYNLELLRLRMLLETSLSVFFVALISLLLFSIPLPELTVWKSANIIQSALHVTGLLLLAFRASKLKLSGLAQGRNGIHIDTTTLFSFLDRSSIGRRIWIFW